MDPKELKAIVTEVLTEQVKPLQDSVKGLETGLKTLDDSVKAIDGRMKPLEEQGKDVVRYDAKGQVFKFPGGGSAPAHVKAPRGDSKPLMVSNILRGCMLSGGVSHRGVMELHAKDEMAISDRLRAAGYGMDYMGSLLFPMASELILEPVDEKGEKQGDLSLLRKEIAEREHLRVDPGELAWLAKRVPDVAKAFGLEAKDLQLGDDTLGGFLVPAVQSDRIIDLLRAAAVLVQAGATELPLPPSGNLSYPRLTSDPTFAYADPDTVTDAATSNITTGMVRLAAKSLRGFVTIPNDLLRYSSPAVEMIVRAALGARAALAEDTQGLEGVGSAIAPKGLINYGLSVAETPAAGKVTLHVAATVGANGDTIEPEDIAKILALYYMANDPQPPTGWITRPLLWAAITNRRADAVSAGDKKGPFMFPVTRGDASNQPVRSLQQVPVFPTTQASNNRVKGSGTTLVYNILGNWRRFLIGRSGALELAVSEHVKFLQDKTIIRAVLRSDFGLEHEQSFVLTDTLLES